MVEFDAYLLDSMEGAVEAKEVVLPFRLPRVWYELIVFRAKGLRIGSVASIPRIVVYDADLEEPRGKVHLWCQTPCYLDETSVSVMALFPI